MTKLRWGIISTGRIAQTFVQGVSRSHTGEVVAVASRTKASAKEFARKNGIAKFCELLRKHNLGPVFEPKFVQ